MPRYAMVIDLTKCVGCQACTAACNKEWDVPLGFARTRVHPTGIQGTFPNLSSGFRVAQCNHCDRPSCVAACPTGATRQSDDGVVHIDRGLCIGCGYCVDACPYDARYLSPTLEQADKCDFCTARRERGLEPACVATCTAHAKYFGDLEDTSSEVFRMVYERGARRLESREVAIGPNVFYLGRERELEPVLASFTPHLPRPVASREFWAHVLKPLVLAGVGATFLGQAVAFFYQLASGEPEDRHQEQK